jgi:hypothetical protein
VVRKGASLRERRLQLDLNCQVSARSEILPVMKLTKNIGIILLAVYVIIDSLLGFGLNLGPFIFLLYLVGLAAGIFLLIGK